MRVLSFSGHDWVVKSSGESLVGPGGNLFSDAERAVWVDGEGALHLTITRHQRAWHCTEVMARPALRCGRYRFHVESDLAFDRNVVAGMFLYLDDHHEIDIEIARFGSVNGSANAQFAVQPLDRHQAGFIHRLVVPPRRRPSIHEIGWFRDAVHFRSLTASGNVVAEASTRRPVPHGALKARINLWLHAAGGKRGFPPVDGCEAELVIGAFHFTADS